MAEPARFEFGANWRRCLTALDEERIADAERSLSQMLGRADLRGSTFLDVGSGSGLLSLAARRLGARVTSIDYDGASVACTRALRDRYSPGDPEWAVERSDVTDAAAFMRLGSFDVVYGWGVLHHTGAMWRALDNCCRLVRPGGRLFISIYNDQGRRSRVWLRVKRMYVRLPPLLRPPFVVAVSLPIESRNAAKSLITGELRAYARSWRRWGERGMNRWYDVLLVTVAGANGCNEYVFEREADDREPRAEGGKTQCAA